MAIFGKKDTSASNTDGSTGGEEAIDTYKVTYKGGHRDLPKAKIGEIRMLITAEAFVFNPTIGSKSFWQPLTIPYTSVSAVEIAARQVGTGEALLGGLNSRQLNQDNNIHVSYTNADGSPAMLRFEMLSGVSVMGQAKKCREFEDRLGALGITGKFAQSPESGSVGAVVNDIPAQSAQLAALRDQGILSGAEFEAKKADLLSRL